MCTQAQTCYVHKHTKWVGEGREREGEGKGEGEGEGEGRYQTTKVWSGE
jgi:hypothetical protein